MLVEAGHYKVISLTGPWGAGKTFLWNELKQEAGISAGYVSLFGIANRAEIKRRLGASLLKIQTKEGQEGLTALWRSIRNEIRERLADFGEGYGWIGAAAKVLGDVAGHRLLDEILKGQVLVIDDLERAGDALTIDAILGTIDELKSLRCTIVVILNEDELKARCQSSAWDRFKEKAIDITVALQTTPADAFDAIAPSIDPDLRHYAGGAWAATRCCNIRIAQRVALTIRTVIGDVRIDPKPLSAVISDIVYLTVAEYRGFHPAADATETLRAHRQYSFLKESPDERRREEIRAASPVSFSHYQDFQLAVIGFLKTGHGDIQSFRDLLGKIEATSKAGDADNRLLEWRMNAFWDPTTTDEDLRRSATALLPEVWRQNPNALQEFVFALKELEAPDLAEAAIEKWCEEVWERKIPHATSPLFKPIEPIDPRVSETVSRVDELMNPPPSLIEAMRQRIFGQNSEGVMKVIRNASVEDWVALLMEATTPEPLRFTHDLLRHNTSPDIHHAQVNIRAAYARIHRDYPDTRLARVLARRGLVGEMSASASQPAPPV